MQITNETTTYEIAELMGPEADETDGRIMLSMLLDVDGTRGGPILDTEDVSEEKWVAMVEATQRIRKFEQLKENWQ